MSRASRRKLDARQQPWYPLFSIGTHRAPVSSPFPLPRCPRRAVHSTPRVPALLRCLMAQYPSVPTRPPASAVEGQFASNYEGNAHRTPKSLAQWRKPRKSLMCQRLRLRHTLAPRGVLAQPTSVHQRRSRLFLWPSISPALTFTAVIRSLKEQSGSRRSRSMRRTAPRNRSIPGLGTVRNPHPQTMVLFTLTSIQPHGFP